MIGSSGLDRVRRLLVDGHKDTNDLVGLEGKVKSIVESVLT